MEAAFIAFGGVVLGWVLAAGTQFLRDRHQAEIALMLVSNELISNIAQLDLARRVSGDEGELHLSHWYRQWRLSRAAYDQHGPLALSRLDPDGIATLQMAYHAFDAAALLLEEAREGVIAVRQVNLLAPEHAETVTRLVELDAETRKLLDEHIDALFRAQSVVNRALPAKRRLAVEQGSTSEARPDPSP